MTGALRLLGLGAALPAGCRTNADLAHTLQLEPGWIEQRTGIRSRRVLGDTEDLTTLAADAGRQALLEAGRAVDLVIAATVTAPEATPALASRVAQVLGLNVPAFDVSAACSGFVFALATARAHILAGDATSVLVIGADRLANRVLETDRDTAILFGDGAGAVVLAAGAAGPCIEGVVLGGDPQHADALRLHRVVEMDGRLIFRQATLHLEATVRALCARLGWAVADVDLLVPHQANHRILEATARRLGLPVEKIFNNIGEIGNTSAASIPIALAQARAEGSLLPGARVVLAALGAGLVWGAVGLVWGSTD